MINWNGKIPEVIAYGTAADYCQLPSEEQACRGVVPLDSLPAAWWNRMWHDNNVALNCSRAFVNNVGQELCNIIICSGGTINENCNSQLYSTIFAVGTADKVGMVKSSTTNGQVSIASSGIMTVNGYGNAALQTTAQTVTEAINELKDAIDNFQGVTYSGTKPLVDGTAAAGTSDTAARGDHVHPIGCCIKSQYTVMRSDQGINELCAGHCLGYNQLCAAGDCGYNAICATGCWGRNDIHSTGEFGSNNIVVLGGHGYNQMTAVGHNALCVSGPGGYNLLSATGSCGCNILCACGSVCGINCIEASQCNIIKACGTVSPGGTCICTGGAYGCNHIRTTGTRGNNYLCATGCCGRNILCATGNHGRNCIVSDLGTNMLQAPIICMVGIACNASLACPIEVNIQACTVHDTCPASICMVADRSNGYTIATHVMCVGEASAYNILTSGASNISMCSYHAAEGTGTGTGDSSTDIRSSGCCCTCVNLWATTQCVRNRCVVEQTTITRYGPLISLGATGSSIADRNCYGSAFLSLEVRRPESTYEAGDGKCVSSDPIEQIGVMCFHGNTAYMALGIPPVADCRCTTPASCYNLTQLFQIDLNRWGVCRPQVVPPTMAIKNGAVNLIPMLSRITVCYRLTGPNNYDIYTSMIGDGDLIGSAGCACCLRFYNMTRGGVLELAPGVGEDKCTGSTPSLPSGRTCNTYYEDIGFYFYLPF